MSRWVTKEEFKSLQIYTTSFNRAFPQPYIWVQMNEKLEFILDGQEPCYIDIPIWYTHNIENIGDEDLITVFWINEHYNDETSDTYIENV